MSNVELINIGLDGFNKWDTWESLGLEYLATVLNKNNIVANIKSVNRKNMDNCISSVVAEKPTLIGFTLPCYYEDKLEYLGGKLKQLLPNVHITLGNRFASDNSDMLFARHTWVDSIIRGEGEESIIALYNRLINKESLLNCEGVYYRDNDDSIIKNADRKLIDDLNSIPIVDHSMIDENNTGHAWVCSSRGCVNDCSFCNSRCDRMQKGRVLRYRSPENVADELEILYKEKNCTNITFVDCSYEDPGKIGKDRIKRIAELLIERNVKIKYGVYFSSHNWKDDDKELLELLYKSGLVCVYIGFESAYEDTLKLFNKRASVEDNEKVIELLNEVGISLKYGFIMNHPYLTLDEFATNNKFLARNGLAYALGSYYNELFVMKGTKIYDKVKADGMQTEKVDPELGAIEWQFVDEDAKLLHDLYVKLADDDVIKRLKSSEWFYKVVDIRHYFYQLNLSEKTRQIHENFTTELDKSIGKINMLNYQLAKDMLSIVKERNHDSRFEEYKQKFVYDADILIKKVDYMIVKYIYDMKKSDFK